MTAEARQSGSGAFTSGSVAEWSGAWADVLDDPASVLTYTAGEPSTVKALYHRYYFEDLWSEMADRAANGRYLELGAGRGTTSMYLRARGCDVTMVDLSEEAMELARRSFAHVGLPVPRLVRADAEATELPAGSFDCVYNIGLLEHFHDPRRVLAESLRLLAPGGLLFSVVVPETTPLRALTSQALFTPWRVPRTIARAVRLRLAPPKPVAGAALRTRYGGEDYAQWARDLGAVDVACVPYNPYRECYESRKLQGRLQVPIYRVDHNLRRAARLSPSMRCSRWIAQCELLTFRKAP